MCEKRGSHEGTKTRRRHEGEKIARIQRYFRDRCEFLCGLLRAFVSSWLPSFSSTRQMLHQPVDLLLGVVEVRRGAQSAFAQGDLRAVLATQRVENLFMVAGG